MDKLWTKAVEYNYTEYNRALTGQFRHGLGNEGMIGEILREVLTLGTLMMLQVTGYCYGSKG